MAIGYACKTIGVSGTDMRSCALKDATEERLLELIRHNIASLDRMIDYNIENHIKLFRISSDLIPFGSSHVNSIKWWEHYGDLLKTIGKKIRDSNMRVSLHPGQYTVLNSEKKDVVENAVKDLAYHARILDSLGLDSTHKMVLHIGGSYGDKGASAQRFIRNYRMLDESIRRRLVIENDDRIFNIKDVLEIGMELSIPVVFDNLHNEANPSDDKKDEFDWIDLCRNTWKEQDGYQKIHYSQQAKQKKKGSHSDFIKIDGFMDFYKRINRNDVDIMLEVKDKNLSCIKCINCIAENSESGVLEKEWGRYRYTVLERSPLLYAEIDRMLRERDCSPVDFYRLIEQSLEREGDVASHSIAVLSVWEYLRGHATEKESRTFNKNLEKYQKRQIGINTVKNQLRKLAEKYEQYNLADSYYFYL